MTRCWSTSLLLRASLRVTRIALDRLTARSQPTEDAKAPVIPAACSRRREHLHSTVRLLRIPRTPRNIIV